MHRPGKSLAVCGRMPYNEIERNGVHCPAKHIGTEREQLMKKLGQRLVSAMLAGCMMASVLPVHTLAMGEGGGGHPIS